MGTGCISCGKWFPYEELDGGHFIPTTSSDIRFDERNINAQCHRCNRFLHGNPRHYYKGMLRKFGQDVVNDIESREFLTKKWSRDELVALKLYYGEKIKQINLGIDPRTSGNSGMEMSDMFQDIPEPREVL